MKNQPLIYIVTSNYNNTQCTIDFLSSVHELSYSNYGIIVVDDGSADDSIESIVNLFPEITLIRNAENLHYCRSFNVGVRAALAKGAEYVFIVNNDTKDFSQNYLEEILLTFQRDSSIGMVGSRCVDYVGGERRGAKSSWRLGIELDVPSEGYVIKREVFEKVGLFNEWLICFFEDLDFIARLTEKGFCTDINLQVSFAHLGAGTQSKLPFTSNYYRVRNLIMFTKKYCTHRSLMTNLREIKGELGVHYSKFTSSLRDGDFLIASTILGAVVSGLVVGTVIPAWFGWKQKYLGV